MKARKYLPLVVVLVALAALVFLTLPVALAGGPAPTTTHPNSVRVTMQCDKGVTGFADVYLDASSSPVSPATQIYCGESQVVATTGKADSYRAVVQVRKSSSGGTHCSRDGLLPDTLYCSVGPVPVGERSAGGTLRLARPK